MSTPHVAHAIFTVERSYPQSPAKVFAAWSSAEAKSKWFHGGEGWKQVQRELDFRVGGKEIAMGKRNNGEVTTDFRATYHDIVPEQRIVYSYGMRLNDVRISVSLATIEFKAEGSGTRLIITEQGAFLDGYKDEGSRQRGTAQLLEQIATALETKH